MHISKYSIYNKLYLAHLSALLLDSHQSQHGWDSTSVQMVVIISPWKTNKEARLYEGIKHTHKNNIISNVRKLQVD